MNFQEYLQREGIRHTSIKSYIKVFKQIKNLTSRVNTELDDFTYDDLMAYIKRRRTRVSVRTINSEIRILRHYFNYLILQGLRFDNPAKGLIVKGEKRNKLYSPIPEEKLLEIYKNYPSETNIEIRNKVLLGLYIFQGLTTTEITNLNTFNIDLDECQLTIPLAAKNAGRTVQIKSLQLIPLVKYLGGVREQINPNEEIRLIVSAGGSKSLQNVTSKLFKYIKKEYPEVQSWQHIRVSVITNEFTESNLRQCQYKFGFRHIDSIEKYLQNNVEDLREELDRCFI